MKIIVANWKSHKTAAQAHQWVNEFQQHALPKVTIVVAPPFPLIPMLTEAFMQGTSGIAIAAQDVSPFPTGAYTGAVAAETLVSVGATYVIVGHSERRQYFHETNQDVANKVTEAVAAGMTPIVCVDLPYLESQVAAIPEQLLSKCWFTYEPLEAIGSGNNQPAAEVAPIVKKIKKLCGKVTVLYGGSVNPDNVQEYLTATDGVLVGHASLKASECLALAKQMA